MRALPVALHCDNHEGSHWLRSTVAQIPAMWERHGVVCCSHVVTRPAEDTVTWLTLGRPTGLTCSQCTDRLPTGSTCARCGITPEQLTGIAVSWTVLGRPVQIAIGLCQTCLDLELPK